MHRSLKCATDDHVDQAPNPQRDFKRRFYAPDDKRIGTGYGGRSLHAHFAVWNW